MKKKIALVTATPMSIHAFLIPTIKQLSKKYDVTIITNTSDQSINLDAISDRVKIIHCPISRQIKPLKDLISLFQLTRILWRGKFSLTHSFTPKAGFLTSVAAKLVGIKNRLHTFTGQVWATEAGLKRKLLKGIDKITSRLDDAIIVDSFSQRDFLISNNVIPKTKTPIVFCNGSISGVDVNRFKPKPDTNRKIRQDLGIGEEAIVFLYMGRLKRDKGILDLANAFKQMTDPRATLVIVGKDEEDLQPIIRALLTGKEDKVRFLPHVDKPEDMMAVADVLCLPSYREGFGTVVIEAAACGVPAIGSNIYGLSDAIKDKETGYLFPVKDTDRLFNLMSNFLVDDSLRNDMGQEALENAKQNFAHEKIIQAWSDLYETRI